MLRPWPYSFPRRYHNFSSFESFGFAGKRSGAGIVLIQTKALENRCDISTRGPRRKHGVPTNFLAFGMSQKCEGYLCFARCKIFPEFSFSKADKPAVSGESFVPKVATFCKYAISRCGIYMFFIAIGWFPPSRKEKPTDFAPDSSVAERTGSPFPVLSRSAKAERTARGERPPCRKVRCGRRDL